MSLVPGAARAGRLESKAGYRCRHRNVIRVMVYGIARGWVACFSADSREFRIPAPNAYLRVLVAREDVPLVGGPGGIDHQRGVALKDLLAPAGIRIPNTHRVIV